MACWPNCWVRRLRSEVETSGWFCGRLYGDIVGIVCDLRGDDSNENPWNMTVPVEPMVVDFCDGSKGSEIGMCG
jgi:hypothetical protein